MSNLVEEISRRRTFAIISHPDAGKTTLTEKFLLYGGAIKGDRVDLYLPTYEECMEFGRRVCTVYYLG